MEIENFKDMILNDRYILWLSKFIEKYGYVDDEYFAHEYRLSKDYKKNISYLKYLFLELNKYAVKNEFNLNNIISYYLKYKDNVYHISYNSEGGYRLEKCIFSSELKCIEYNDFKRQYKKNMENNFKKLKERVIDGLNNSDLEKINYELSKINTPTLVSGVGGSNVVADYASKVLNLKNNIITKCTDPRDLKYLNLAGYSNVLSCSYSGNNYGVELSFLNNLKHYLLASKENNQADVNLIYNTNDKEISFISLGATLIPCSILLNYYLRGNNEKIVNAIDSYKYNFNVSCDAFEIFTGLETSTASKYLESTMVESGIGIPIIHDKYAYCHGRSTLSTINNNIAIYFNLNTELDKLLMNELYKYYKDVIIINSENSLLSEFTLLIKCMYLTKYIAERKNKDLSGVDYNPIVKKLYRYNGML